MIFFIKDSEKLSIIAKLNKSSKAYNKLIKKI